MDLLNSRYQYLITIYDTHRAWEAFEIILHGTVLELIRLNADKKDIEELSPINNRVEKTFQLHHFRAKVVPRLATEHRKSELSCWSIY